VPQLGISRSFRHSGYAKDGELDAAAAAVALEDLHALDLQRHADEPLLDRARELRHSLSAYDAVYVALAEALEPSDNVKRARRRLGRIALVGHEHVVDRPVVRAE
jgi:hypothetical protein